MIIAHNIENSNVLKNNVNANLRIIKLWKTVDDSYKVPVNNIIEHDPL